LDPGGETFCHPVAGSFGHDPFATEPSYVPLVGAICASIVEVDASALPGALPLDELPLGGLAASLVAGCPSMPSCIPVRGELVEGLAASVVAMGNASSERHRVGEPERQPTNVTAKAASAHGTIRAVIGASTSGRLASA
jgi:hypothetical protein